MCYSTERFQYIQPNMLSTELNATLNKVPHRSEGHLLNLQESPLEIYGVTSRISHHLMKCQEFKSPTLDVRRARKLITHDSYSLALPANCSLRIRIGYVQKITQAQNLRIHSLNQDIMFSASLHKKFQYHKNHKFICSDYQTSGDQNIYKGYQCEATKKSNKMEIRSFD